MYDRSETPDHALCRREHKLLSNRASVWMICATGEEPGA
jgi:hypothetical protein